MKKIAALIAMLALMIISWARILAYHDDSPEKFAECMKQAEGFEENRQYKYAINKYLEALKYDTANPDVYKHLVMDYKELNQLDKAEEKCEYMIEHFEDNYNAYLDKIKFCEGKGRYADALTVLINAREKYTDDEELEKLWVSLRGKYSQNALMYENVSEIRDNQIKVQSLEGMYGVVNLSGGTQALDAVYTDCTIFTNITENEKLAAICKEDEIYYVDDKGYRCVVTEEAVDSAGLYCEGVSAVSKGGKYAYYQLDNERMMLVEKTKPEYDGLTTMYQKMAAVKKGDSWAVVNDSLEEITKYDFEEIVQDDFGICSNQGVVFARKKGSHKYSLIGADGSYICEDAFELVKPFPKEGYAAVCVEGKWGWIDAKGEEKTKFTYENAGAMTNGYAAVCIGGIWGYIDEEENICIPCEFQEAKAFDDKGNAIVKKDNQWMMIHLYLYDVKKGQN